MRTMMIGMTNRMVSMGNQDDVDDYTLMEETALQKWWRFQWGWVSTSSGAALALQVSIAVWSEAAGICRRKNCSVCAKFCFSMKTGPCCSCWGTILTANIHVVSWDYSRNSWMHLSLDVCFLILPPALHISQISFQKPPKSIGHEPVELSACRWREQQKERHKEAEWIYPFEKTAEHCALQSHKHLYWRFNNKCLPLQ